MGPGPRRFLKPDKLKDTRGSLPSGSEAPLVLGTKSSGSPEGFLQVGGVGVQLYYSVIRRPLPG